MTTDDYHYLETYTHSLTLTLAQWGRHKYKSCRGAVQSLNVVAVTLPDTPPKPTHAQHFALAIACEPVPVCVCVCQCGCTTIVTIYELWRNTRLSQIAVEIETTVEREGKLNLTLVRSSQKSLQKRQIINQLRPQKVTGERSAANRGMNLLN